MWVVFYDGKFVNFWLNDYNDKTWIERTISAMGWNPLLFEVRWYPYGRTNDSILMFDDNKKLHVMAKESREIERPEEPGVFDSKEVLVKDRGLDPETHFSEGVKHPPKVRE